MKLIEAAKVGDTFRVRFHSTSSNDTLKKLILSDVHFDSTKCDRGLLRESLEECDFVFDNGDLLDCMGGKYDPRSSKADIRPEYQKKNYFDAIVEDVCQFLEPFKEKFLFINQGNHEGSVLQRHETDLTQRIADGLSIKLVMSYTGFVRFQFCSKEDDPNYGQLRSDMWYITHGDGGNAPVTLGVIGTARRQEFIEADVIVSGHIHNQFVLPRTKVYVDNSGMIKTKKVVHIQVGTLKNSNSYWEKTKGFRPAGIGGQFIEYKSKAGKIERNIPFVD